MTPYILTGFSQEVDFRVFTFSRINSDRTRARFTVKADVTLIRKYRIPLQELPLLCRSLLERREEGSEVRSLIFSEEDMRVHAEDLATKREALAHRRKPPHRPSTENTGAAWRGTRTK